jgi:LacI family transcriptional regulator
MSITIKKIAEDLQLAVSTVSKALRDSHEISIETKKRVFEHAAKLNYLPNPYASSLKGKSSGNIAVVLPEVADSFFSTAINGIESIAQDKGYHVIVYLTHEDLQREQSILKSFRSGRVDGVLMSVSGGTENDDHIRDLCEAGIPLVFFDRVSENIPAAKVVTNDFDSGYQAAEHLIKNGCKRIAFLSMAGNLAITNQRLLGFKKAHVDHNLSVKNNQVIYCAQQESQTFDQIKKLLQRKDRPDGVVGSVEKVTTQVYSVCHALKVRIPRDIKVIGFSNLPIAALLNPALTTITQPAFEMGKAAATILFKALERKKIDLRKELMVIPSTLYPRESTRKK